MTTTDWTLGEVAWVPGVRHAVLATSDGLVRARSEDTSEETAERVAAACAGLHSLTASLAGEFGTAGRAVHQVMAGFDGGFLFVRRAANGAALAVITEATVDPGVISQQMQATIIKIGEATFTTPPRPPGIAP